jgi:hypothetical protein
VADRSQDGDHLTGHSVDLVEVDRLECVVFVASPGRREDGSVPRCQADELINELEERPLPGKPQRAPVFLDPDVEGRPDLACVGCG